MRRRVAAVTGATGFLGSHVVGALADRGVETRILARRSYRHPVWQDIDLEFVPGDLNDDSAIRRFVSDADIVIHAAGVTAARSRNEFFSVNCGGTRKLAKAAALNAPAARFLLVSSLAAREPELSDYAASKQAAERVVQETLPADRVTIVRPPAIYGPWDRGTLPFFKAAAARIAPRLPDRDGRVALIHVEDAAAAIAQLAIHDEAIGRYALADRNPQGYSWPEILAALARAIGTKPKYVEVPEWLLKAVARTTPLLQVISARPVTFSAGKVRELLHPDWSVTPSELPPESLWGPVYDIERGFHSTVTWLRFVGWLPH